MAIEINLKGKVVLVTGGTRGIGKSIVKYFLLSGAKVLATGTNFEYIKKLNSQNENKFLIYVQLDLNDSENVNNFISTQLANHNIDILINNAGVNIVTVASEILEKDFDKVQKINVNGPFLLAKAFGKKMVERKWGRIVNIASIWSVVTRSGRLSYSASKMALLGINKTLAVEWAQHNVLVNCISPGFTLTELTKSTNTQEELKKIKNKIPQKRMANPEDIAKGVLFISSELNSYIVGQNIIIDGGYTVL